MGKLHSEDGLFLYASQLTRFFSARLLNPKELKKLEWELLIGLLLSQFLRPSVDCEVQIGVPIDKNEKPLDPSVGFTLEDLLSRPKLRRDHDIDIVIWHDSISFKFQVARVVKEDIGRGRRTFEEILFRKIEKQPPDGKLFLAILLEENTSVAEALVLSLLELPIPFGDIFLLGKMNEVPGEFHCQTVFPERKRLRQIQLPFAI